MEHSKIQQRFWERGFHRNPVAAVKTRESVPEIGSWVWRERPTARRQLHVMVFENTNRDGAVDIYAHEEYAYINLFGTLRGTVYSMTGVLAGSAIVFGLARRDGRPYVERQHLVGRGRPRVSVTGGRGRLRSAGSTARRERAGGPSRKSSVPIPIATNTRHGSRMTALTHGAVSVAPAMRALVANAVALASPATTGATAPPYRGPPLDAGSRPTPVASGRRCGRWRDDAQRPTLNPPASAGKHPNAGAATGRYSRVGTAPNSLLSAPESTGQNGAPGPSSVDCSVASSEPSYPDRPGAKLSTRPSNPS